MTVITAELRDTIDAHAETICTTVGMERIPWLEVRKPYLGASEAAAAIGLSPYESPMSLWVTKTSDGVSDEENEYMRWGQRLEEAIGLGIAEDTGIPVERFPFMMRSREWPWMSVNVDFLSGPTDEYPASVVEVKNVSERKSSEWKDGAVPEHYAIQGQHACAVLGVEGVHFFPLIGGHEGRPVYVERNDGLIESLVEGERKFWDLVKTLTPPEVDGSEATNRALKSLYGKDAEPGKTVAIPPMAVHLLRERAAAKAIIKTQTEYVTEIENKLMTWMGNAEYGTVNGVITVTWKQHTKKTYTVAEHDERRWHVPKGSPALEPVATT